jgi:hypothetical protein
MGDIFLAALGHERTYEIREIKMVGEDLTY